MGGHLSTSPPLDAREVVPVLLTSTNTSTNFIRYWSRHGDPGLSQSRQGCGAAGGARRGRRAAAGTAAAAREGIRGGGGTVEAGGSRLGASASTGVRGGRAVCSGCRRSRDLARAWCLATVPAVIATRSRDLVSGPKECRRRGGPPRCRTSQHPRAEDSDLGHNPG